MKESVILKHIVVGELATNCYIVGDSVTREVLIIDPGDEHEKIKRIIDRDKLKPKFIVNTHGHIDHIGADDKFNLPVYIHSLDKGCFSDPLLNLSGFLANEQKFELEMRLLNDNDTIQIDSLTLNVIHTPGHTKGSICLKFDDVIFTGDTLFCEGIGRTDIPGGSHSQILESIKNRLLNFADNISIYPGHGPTSTIGREKDNNPFCRVT